MPIAKLTNAQWTKVANDSVRYGVSARYTEGTAIWEVEGTSAEIKRIKELVDDPSPKIKDKPPQPKTKEATDGEEVGAGTTEK
jgi:hypothetical protein